MQAAQTGLQWLREHQGRFPEDLGPNVKVEIITTTTPTLPLRAVTGELSEARVA